MTDQDRKRIVQLRNQGYKLAEIAQLIKVNLSTVKTFCRKNGLCTTRAKYPSLEQIDKTCCPQCGKKLQQNTGYKPRRFCSTECRQLWWKKNTDKLNKQAMYFFTCSNCGKNFSAYGNKNRKFCSVQCYHIARFGEAFYQ